MIIPEVIIGSTNVSAYVISIHVEQTSNPNDPDKADITLANTYLRFMGQFAPATPIVARLIRRVQTCDGDSDTTIPLFVGEVQKASTDEFIAKIEASCPEGGMASRLPIRKIYPIGHTVDFVVRDLLQMFGFAGNVVVQSKVQSTLREELEFPALTDFDSCFKILQGVTGSWYLFDEVGTFYYIDPIDFPSFKGRIGLTGRLLNGDQTASVIGHINVVTVIGGSVHKPWEIGAEIKTHRDVHATEEDAASIAENGRLVGPPIFLPNADQEECEKAAKNLLMFYAQYEDQAKPRVYDICPPIGSLVFYVPRNAIPPLPDCDGNAVGGASWGQIEGIVSRRVVDLSASTGLITELVVDTNMSGMGGGGGGYVPINPTTPEEEAEELEDMSDEDLDQEIEPTEEEDPLPPPNVDLTGYVEADDVDDTLILEPYLFAAMLDKAMKGDVGQALNMTYDVYQHQSSWQLAYNPDTGGAYFTDLRDAIGPRSGYYYAVPNAGAIPATSALAQMNYIATYGWPSLSGWL